jgi:hypothetical protein
MTLDDDSAIVTVPPSPPESRLLVGRAAQWRAPSPLDGAGIRLRHEQHIRNALWKWRITAASELGIEIAN